MYELKDSSFVIFDTQSIVIIIGIIILIIASYVFLRIRKSK